MAKYVLKADLPEVTFNDEHQFLVIDGESFGIQGKWSNPSIWRREAMNYLAGAEFLEARKTLLPTEPGSVILATKVNGYPINGDGDYLSLRRNGFWRCLDGCSVAQAAPQDIEEWVPVKLVPQIEGAS